jgi:serine/threonine-protein kinase RsbT
MQQSISGDRVMITSGSDIVAARHRGRILALALGFEETEVVQVTTVVSELGRGILAQSGVGEIVLQAVVEDGRPGIVLSARDRELGIPKLRVSPTNGASSRGDASTCSEDRTESEFGVDTKITVRACCPN